MLYDTNRGDNRGKWSSEEESSFDKNRSSFLTALCVVPPTEAWDSLQRARHLAQDPAYNQWPPAIRLFHPFVTSFASSCSHDNGFSTKSTSSALEVAQVIEELELEPFTVTLDQWTILPHMEVIQLELEKQSLLPHPEPIPEPERTEDDEILELIALEEQRGREKLLARQNAQLEQTKKQKKKDEPPSERKQKRKTKTKSKKNPSDQNNDYLEFNGPCILCLEPDAKSKRALCELHDALREMLPLEYLRVTSPSSVYSWNITKSPSDDGNYESDDDLTISSVFRPLIPISVFPTVTMALPVARKLKGLWDPLTFDVNELHIVSCIEDEDAIDDSNANSPSSSMMGTSSAPRMQSFQSNSGAFFSCWGCNAKIMLMGKEVVVDEKENMKLLQALLDHGQPGGLDISMDYTVLDDEEDDGGSLESWLNDDEDFDEGTEVTIGRTHFYTGDKRSYNAMPATSSMDAKDRMRGGNVQGGAVSGAARRRRTPSREKRGWSDGDFGRRKSDYQPWSKFESSNRRRSEQVSSWSDFSDLREADEEKES